MARGSRAHALAMALVTSACCSGPDGSGVNETDDDAACVDGREHIVASNVGLSTPESVLHDATSDTYLVSNISGSPSGADDDGFISRFAPDGTLLELAWIDGASDDVELDAPKGMAIVGERLYVTDIEVVRSFDRLTGEAVATIEFDDAGFLNDLAADGDTLYVTDMNRDRIHAIDATTDPATVTTILESGIVSSPNGVSVDAEGRVWAVADGRLFRVEDGAAVDSTELPVAGLDGVEWRSNGAALISSWETGSIYEGTPGGTFAAKVCELSSPADIGYDATRDRVLIPRFHEDELAWFDLGG